MKMEPQKRNSLTARNTIIAQMTRLDLDEKSNIEN